MKRLLSTLSLYIPHRHHPDYITIAGGRIIPGWRWSWVRLLRRILHLKP